MEDVIVFDAMKLRFHLCEHLTADVQSIQLKSCGKFGLRPANCISQFPNLRPNHVFGASGWRFLGHQRHFELVRRYFQPWAQAGRSVFDSLSAKIA